MLLLLSISLCFTGVFTGKVLYYDYLLAERKPAQKPLLHLVLISEELDNPYWREIEKGAQRAAAEEGIALEYLGPVQADKREQIRIIDKAIASKVDGILTQGLNDKEFNPIIAEAVKQGIPVITIDSDAPSSGRIAYVGTDNYAAGYLAGTTLVQQSKGVGQVGIVTGSFTSTNQQQRVKGFMDAIDGESGIHVVQIEESNINRIQSEVIAFKIMNQHPEIDTFLGTSSLDGLGIAQMLKGKNQQARIIAFDDLPETLEFIEEGIIDASIVQQPYMMGRKSIELMVDYLAGKKIVTIFNTDANVVRKEEISRGKGDFGP